MAGAAELCKPWCELHGLSALTVADMKKLNATINEQLSALGAVGPMPNSSALVPVHNGVCPSGELPSLVVAGCRTVSALSLQGCHIGQPACRHRLCLPVHSASLGTKDGCLLGA